MQQLLKKIRRTLNDKKNRRQASRVVSSLCCVIVFVTTYAMVLPAITMEQQAQCGIEAHQHSDSCYELQPVCGLEESADHAHTDACYEKVLICGKEAHVHSKACYTDAGKEMLDEVFTAAQDMEQVSAEEAMGAAGGSSETQTADTPVVASGDAQSAGADSAISGAQDTDPAFSDAQGTDPAFSDVQGTDAAAESTQGADGTSGDAQGASNSGTASPSPEETAEGTNSDPAGNSAAGDFDEVAPVQPGQADSATDINGNTGEYASEDKSGEASATDAADTAEISAPAQDAGAGTDAAAEDSNMTEAQESAAMSEDMPALIFEDTILIQTATATAKQADAETAADAQAGAESQTDAQSQAGTESQTDAGISPARDLLPAETNVTVHVEAEEGTFPAGTSMVLATVQDEALDKVAEAVNNSVEGTSHSFQAVDISFRDASGNEIEPAKPVRVTMTSDAIKTASETPEIAEPVVLHMVDEGAAEKIEQTDLMPASDAANSTAADESAAFENAQTANENLNASPDTVAFDSDQFSTYVIVYTVDFHYEVNGKTYEFSLPGGGFVSFTDLVEVLGIIGDAYSGENGAETDVAEPQAADGMLNVTASDEAKKFAADVASVAFSSPELVWIGKAEEETTVGALKEANGLECQYSSELTEEQINGINSTAVESGDWALISMLPFDTEETMTVTMKDGEVFTVKVTDAQISSMFLSDSGDLYEVTVTYGDDAQIPEGSRLEVTEYGTLDDKYIEAWDTVVAANKKAHKVFDENYLGLSAFDISIKDSEGNIIEPKNGAEVQVSIQMKSLPENVEESVLNNTMEVQHLNESTGEIIVETVANAEDIRVENGSVATSFVIDSFSTFTITWSLPAASVSDANASFRLRYQTPNNWYQNAYSQNVRVWYVDESGANIQKPNGQNDVAFNANYYPNTTIDLSDYTTLSGYEFIEARYSASTNNKPAGQTVDSVQFVTSGNNRTANYYYNGERIATNTRTNTTNNDTGNVYLVYRSHNQRAITVHYGEMINGRFVEYDSLPAGAQTAYGPPTSYGDQINIRHDIEGKDFVTVRMGDPDSGTQISPMLQTENRSTYSSYPYWKYRILDTLEVNDGINEWQRFNADEDLYVIYRDTPTQKSYDDGGLTPEDLAAPATNKDVEANGDGTYDVSLSVTGTSNSKHNKTHANIVIVLDTSSSMSGTDTGVSGQTRLQAAKNAIYTLADQLFGFNSSDDPAAVEIAFVDFSHRVRNEMTKDTIYSGVVNGADYRSFRSLIQGLNYNGGTNYDTAIEAANSVLWKDADPEYVIFVTDGDTVSRGYLEYDESGSADHAADWDGGTYYNGDPGATTAEYYARARSAAKIQLNKLLANTNNKFYSIGVFGNVQYLRELGGTYLGQANNEKAITDAFASIIEDLELNLGYKAVTIHDGITALTSTTLVNGVADQFRYKITKKDGTVQTFDSDEALQAEYPGIGTATYTANGSEKEVQWNLGKNYQLEDGVTYELTFTVWPSQEAYDYLADFNNRVRNITAQDASVKKQFFVKVDGSTYQYVENKGWTTDIPAKEASSYITDTAMQSLINAATSLTHYIRTNTRASVDYTSVKTENDTVTETKTVTGAEIRDPNGKMILDGTGIQMQKVWNDSLASSELLELLTDHLNDEKTDTTYSVTLHMWQDKGTGDEKEVHTAAAATGFVIKPTVTIVDGKVTAAVWPAHAVAISPGVMVESTEEKEQIYKDTTKYPRVTYGKKTFIILETGHTYSITEDNIDLHFELSTDVYHPMVVNGVLKMVKFGTNESGDRIVTEMSPDGTALTTLTATNNLKGGLDVMKFVTTKDDASDTVDTDETYFTFRIKLQKSETDTTPVYTTPDQFNEDGSTISGSLGFRIFAAPDIPAEAENVADDKSSYVFDGLTYRANRNSEGEIYSYTARGTVPESGVLTLKIRQSMLGGTETNRLDRIRIVNVPAGIYYTVEEIDVPAGYTKLKSEHASGTTQANTQPTAAFWNKRSSLTVDLLKVDELDHSKVLADAEFKLYKEDGTTEATDADGKTIGTIKTGTDGKATIGKLVPGTYKLVETKEPEGYILMSSPVTIVVSSERVTFLQGTKQPTDGTKSSDGLTWTITATNSSGYELPATGGPGTTLLYLLGIMLTGLAGAGLVMKSLRRNVA